jgi:peptidoglycan/LPS O-acetylase OafA/YrhL
MILPPDVYEKNHELAGIEILRFVCAFGVIVWHYHQFFFTGGWDSGIAAGLRPKFPAYALPQWFYENVSLTVPLFWVISGFIFYCHYAEYIRSTVKYCARSIGAGPERRSACHGGFKKDRLLLKATLGREP